ncbi:hypothetical protein [Streptomyces catenulae]|uniref:Uncharacterized protein n=1 Tax=Streptomyces catenulae TaxID=66875 RepID=A0ABV2Z1J8_9ACTN|nr:hypothetical protein [Streptomyces catenulae]
MRNRSIIAALGTAAAAVLAFGAGPASADSGPGPTIQRTHRGSTGCFNWSWADGTVTTTVYWHNTCKTSHFLRVRFGDTGHCFQTAGHKKAHATFGAPPSSIRDTGTKGCAI